jgi:hypothetical protein
MYWGTFWAIFSQNSSGRPASIRADAPLRLHSRWMLQFYWDALARKKGETDRSTDRKESLQLKRKKD